MMEGFNSVEEGLKKFPLSQEQEDKLDKMVEGIDHYRIYLNKTEGRFQSNEPIFQTLSQKEKKKILVRPSQQDNLQYGLSRSEVAQFEKDGLIGPFDLMTPEEASMLKERI